MIPVIVLCRASMNIIHGVFMYWSNKVVIQKNLDFRLSGKGIETDKNKSNSKIARMLCDICLLFCDNSLIKSKYVDLDTLVRII